jgi:phage repressor protein C with HTH and peptisase S24 domain
MITGDFINIMEKIRTHLQEKNSKKIYDKDIAAALNISKEHYSRLKKSNKVPLEAIITFCAKENLVINYILFNQISESLSLATDNIITVKYFKNINSSAGGGSFNYEEDFESLGIDSEIVKQLGGEKNIKNIEAINVIGDSMEPLLKDKSIIFIDRSKTLIEEEEIYVVNTEQGILVKKLRVKTYNFIDLVSVNKIYSKQRLLRKDVCVLGKVVGIGDVGI